MERLTLVQTMPDSLATSFSNWNEQVQELYQLYYELLVSRDCALTATAYDTIDKVLRELMLTLANSLEDLQNAPSSNNPEALSDFLQGHYQQMQDIAAKAKRILNK